MYASYGIFLSEFPMQGHISPVLAGGGDPRPSISSQNVFKSELLIRRNEIGSRTSMLCRKKLTRIAFLSFQHV